MQGIERKAAIAAYKERKVVSGIYRISCQASGESWVGHWTNIDAIKTRLWFTLRQNSSMQKALQSAWNAHGEDQFSFDILERFEEDEPDYIRASRLKERALFWRKKLNAYAI